jgi:NADH-quinone oxidoreductase subunit C
MMDNNKTEEIIEFLNENFPGSILATENSFGIPIIEVDSAMAHKIIKFLKDDSRFAINFLTLLGAVHYPDQKDRELVVVYHLHSWTQNLKIRLKAFLPISNPVIRTVSDIHLCANWMERETYDFYGVIFEGHTNLKRILNEDSMDYFPLRKEYALEDATREDKDDRFFGRFKAQ